MQRQQGVDIRSAWLRWQLSSCNMAKRGLKKGIRVKSDYRGFSCSSGAAPTCSLAGSVFTVALGAKYTETGKLPPNPTISS